MSIQLPSLPAGTTIVRPAASVASENTNQSFRQIVPETRLTIVSGPIFSTSTSGVPRANNTEALSPTTFYTYVFTLAPSTLHSPNFRDPAIPRSPEWPSFLQNLAKWPITRTANIELYTPNIIIHAVLRCTDMCSCPACGCMYSVLAADVSFGRCCEK